MMLHWRSHMKGAAAARLTLWDYIWRSVTWYEVAGL